MAPCSDGTCPVHETFEKALLSAVAAGAHGVEQALEGVERTLATMFTDLNRRLDELREERMAMQTQLGEHERRLGALQANIDAILREGHPLRRAGEAPPPPAEDAPDVVPALPRWAAVAVASSFALGGVALFLIFVIIKDPAVRSALLKALSGGFIQ